MATDNNILAPTAHAVLSPSKAERWCHCTPSALMEASMPEGEASEAAKEGTLAHELCAELLANGEPEDLTPYTLEMIDGAYLYKRTIDKDHNLHLQVEERIDLSHIAKGCFGTCDCWGLSDDGEQLNVYDYKFGQGVEVQAVDNYQLALYAWGVLTTHHKHRSERVTMTIIQPRITGDKVKRWALSTAELREWVEKRIAEQAKEASTGDGSTETGDWCHWCRAAAVCRERAVDVPSEEITAKDPSTLTDEEIGYYVRTADETIKWLKQVQDYALKRSLDTGYEWTGMMLAEGRSVRQWSDEEAALEAIKERTELTDDDLYIRTPLTLAKIEKLLGKADFKEVAGEYVIKPHGAPKLVPVDTKGAIPYTRIDAFDVEE